jgi:hypothetical protein
MDSAYTMEVAGGGYIYGAGTPIAQLYQPGEQDVWPVSDFSICMGAPAPLTPELHVMASEWLSVGFMAGDLNMDGQVDLRDYASIAEPDWTGSLDNLIILQLHDGGSGFTDVTVTADLIRGGIVGEGGDINFFGMVQTTVGIPEPCTVLLLGMGGLLIRKQ